MTDKTVRVVAIALTCVVLGALIGGTTNMVNGAVSPQYFKNIMRWDDVTHIWRASVAQGIFEGLIYGVLFAALFAAVYGIVTRGECTYGYAARFLLCCGGAILTCWAIGGMIAMGLAVLSPEFYRNTFIRVPKEFGAMLKYAWVGGSIWGGQIGGVLTGILGSVIFRNTWRRQQAGA
jgi:hypothetical protein